MSDSFHVCEDCGEPVEPGAPGVLEAVELVLVRGFGSGVSDRAEGLHVFFHYGCYPHGSPRLKLVQDDA